jgi:phosphate transport system permease protein
MSIRTLPENDTPVVGPAAAGVRVVVPAAKGGRGVRKYTADISAVGEPGLWALGGALVFALMLIVAFLLMIFWNGITTFWPKPVQVVTTTYGTLVAGEPFRHDSYRPSEDLLAGLDEERRAAVAGDLGLVDRTLYRVGNFDLYGEDFRWVSEFEVDAIAAPEDFYYFERQAWGPFVGRIESLILDDQPVQGFDHDTVRKAQREARQRFEQIRRLEKKDIGEVNYRIEQERLALRRVQLRHGADSAEYAAATAERQPRIDAMQQAFAAIQQQVVDIRTLDARYRIVLAEVEGRTKETPLSQVVRFYPANTIGLFDKIGIYISRWVEYLTDEPREANMEGGVLPAIFGTVAMTLLMVVIVAPFGVITALYLREYAHQGKVVAAVRIAVNNLAGVPSIVYGVFGLGFFAYTMGTSIDQLFYAERLPNPTFGTGGILWASLTLALLTVPVVIVASEEALSAVPRSMREGSLACGASKWQTIRYVVLPRAMPGVMTGLILAMARGAGEVAPLMLIGVVKLAPELPIDGFFPFVHLERSFMHLGFHIFDVGFQSRNSEAGKPMVFVTTLLLLSLIVAMNSIAITIRNRLKRRFASGGQF